MHEHRGGRVERRALEADLAKLSADELNLAIDTVKHSVTAVLSKLDARDRSQAMLIAFRNDLVDLPARLPRWTP